MDTSRLIALSVLSLTPLTARAAPDPKIVPTEAEVKKAKEEKKDPSPWDPSLVFGANIALATSNNVIGQPHGDSVTAGVNIAAKLDYVEGAVDWRNRLHIQEVFSRTPVVPEFVKAVDILSYESILYYLVSDIFGPFASFKLDTSIFQGDDVRATKVDYLLDGEPLAQGVNRVRLTEQLQPLTLKEAVGVFVGPVTSPELELDMRAGVGAIQIFAEGGRVVADDAATATVELVSLEDVVQAGIVVGAEVKGVLDEGRVGYSAHAEVLFPVINDDPQERDAIELANFDISAKLSFKLFSFASLDYELKILRQPQLIEAWQIQNSLLLNFAYTVVE